MLERVQRTLQRRARLLHVREMLQHQAEQSLAAVLNVEEGLKQERATLKDAEERSRSALRNHLDEQGATSSTVLIPYVHRMIALDALAERKCLEIESLQPRIQQSRHEVLVRHKSKRAMEVLTSKARELVGIERMRAEQRELDDRTSQRFGRGRRGGSEPA